ncbi:MAG: DUF4157 domain-containing protein [Kofleriaceae bacterium]
MRDRRRDGDDHSDDGRSRPAPAPGKQTLTARLARRGDAGPVQRGDVAQAVVDERGAGAPVATEVRTTAESHLGADLTTARVHTDAVARAGADAMGARAFAFGADIFLGTGESERDVGLMAHELTHVVQQGAAGPTPMAKLEVGDAGSPHEQQADAVGAAAARGPRAGGAIVDDGAPVGPGQMTRSQIVAAIRAGIDGELAVLPPEVAGPQRAAVDDQLGAAGTGDAAATERALATHVGHQPTAAAYVAAARAKAHAAATPTVGATLGAGVAAAGAVVDAAAAALGSSMAGVELHTGPEAAQLAARHDARAVTVGRHVAFAAGAYQPGTVEGDALLAHELAHVAQQQGAVGDAAAVAARAPAGDDHAAETDADAGAAAVLARVHGGDDQAQASARPFGQLELRRCPGGNAPAPDPLRQQQQALVAQLDQAIADGQWEVIRARVYPREAAAAHTRARERRAGTRPDLAGLGSVISIDRMVAAIRGLQATWAAKTPAERGAAVFAAANAELAAAGVPRYLDTAIEAMVPRGSFSRVEWKFRLRQATVDAPALADAEAAEVANTAQHESRHAEQHWLRARYLAGEGRSARQIRAETGVPAAIATAAAAAPLGAADPRHGEGQTMDRAFGADGATHAATSNQVTVEQQALDQRRAEAQAARAALAAAATPATVAAATTARDRLRAQIQAVETAYLAYRAIPYEADAHEVGDSTSEAYTGGP